ncbi:MAG: uncharacterized protein KVP18_000906 [Porospora cf. gigantea A]|nr:MAG: hypothetical protein KVP18_000906 [Porospora cf. gigantea A]
MRELVQKIRRRQASLNPTETEVEDESDSSDSLGAAVKRLDDLSYRCVEGNDDTDSESDLLPVRGVTPADENTPTRQAASYFTPVSRIRRPTNIYALSETRTPRNTNTITKTPQRKQRPVTPPQSKETALSPVFRRATRKSPRLLPQLPPVPVAMKDTIDTILEMTRRTKKPPTSSGTPLSAVVNTAIQIPRSMEATDTPQCHVGYPDRQASFEVEGRFVNGLEELHVPVTAHVIRRMSPVHRETSHLENVVSIEGISPQNRETSHLENIVSIEGIYPQHRETCHLENIVSFEGISPQSQETCRPRKKGMLSCFGYQEDDEEQYWLDDPLGVLNKLEGDRELSPKS